MGDGTSFLLILACIVIFGPIIAGIFVCDSEINFGRAIYFLSSLFLTVLFIAFCFFSEQQALSITGTPLSELAFEDIPMSLLLGMVAGWFVIQALAFFVVAGRMQDIGVSKWLGLSVLIPVVGMFVWLALFLVPGDTFGARA